MSKSRPFFTVKTESGSAEISPYLQGEMRARVESQVKAFKTSVTHSRTLPPKKTITCENTSDSERTVEESNSPKV